jgi:hypothetical protein
MPAKKTNNVSKATRSARKVTVEQKGVDLDTPVARQPVMDADGTQQPVISADGSSQPVVAVNGKAVNAPVVVASLVPHNSATNLLKELQARYEKSVDQQEKIVLSELIVSCLKATEGLGMKNPLLETVVNSSYNPPIKVMDVINVFRDNKFRGELLTASKEWFRSFENFVQGMHDAQKINCLQMCIEPKLQSIANNVLARLQDQCGQPSFLMYKRELLKNTLPRNSIEAVRTQIRTMRQDPNERVGNFAQRLSSSFDVLEELHDLEGEDNKYTLSERRKKFLEGITPMLKFKIEHKDFLNWQDLVNHAEKVDQKSSSTSSFTTALSIYEPLSTSPTQRIFSDQGANDQFNPAQLIAAPAMRSSGLPSHRSQVVQRTTTSVWNTDGDDEVLTSADGKEMTRKRKYTLATDKPPKRRPTTVVEESPDSDSDPVESKTTNLRPKSQAQGRPKQKNNGAVSKVVPVSSSDLASFAAALVDFVKNTKPSTTPSEATSTTSSSSDGKGPRCYKCGELGHIRPNCPLRTETKQNYQKGVKREFSAAFRGNSGSHDQSIQPTVSKGNKVRGRYIRTYDSNKFCNKCGKVGHDDSLHCPQCTRMGHTLAECKAVLCNDCKRFAFPPHLNGVCRQITEISTSSKSENF